MNICIEKKQQEAIKRMKILNIDSEVIDDFIKDGTVYMSVHGFNVPIFDFLVKELALKTGLENLYVYYLIQDEANMISIFFISDYKEDWEMECFAIKDNIVYPYVLNSSESSFSEIGAIKVKNVEGCLVRIS